MVKLFDVIDEYLDDSSFSSFVEAVKVGEDPYKAAAAERFQKPIRQVTYKERLEMKTRLMQAIYGV